MMHASTPLALLDAPRSIDIAALFVGPPRLHAADVRGAWFGDAGAGMAGFRERAMVECLDTLAVLRSYREPLKGEHWLTPAASEQRMLAQVNAILGLGREGMMRVAALALDADLPDPGRVFAALMVLGCVRGDAWLVPMRELFTAVVLRHRGEAAAAVEAIGLCPNERVASVLEPLLAHEHPACRAASVRVLAFRGELGAAAWLAAMRDADATVRTAALSSPLRGVGVDDAARGLQPWLEGGSERVGESMVRAALRCGLGLRLAMARACCVRIVSEDGKEDGNGNTDAGWADAARCLAMFGVLDDARLIRPLIEGPAWRVGLQAAALLGSVELMPDLLALLSRFDVSQPQADAVRGAMRAITGLPFDATDNADQAAHRWRLQASAFRADTRYRDGEAIGIAWWLQRLRAPVGRRAERQDMALELLAATQGRAPRFCAFDFVGTQRESLHRIGAWLAASPERRVADALLH